MMITKVKPLILGPIVKGVEDNYSSSMIRLWGKAKASLKPTYLVARYAPIDNLNYGEHLSAEVKAEDDCTGVIEISNLNAGTEYFYQMGYVSGSIDSLEWFDYPSGRFKTDEPYNKSWNFCFGSCRLYAKLGPLVLFGSGDSADRTYDAILGQNPEFWMEIGDQVYYDYMGPIARAKTVKEMRKAYGYVRSLPNLRFLLANKTTYSMGDDHDFHRNNTDHEKKHNDFSTWEAGIKVFREHQSLKGPSYDGPFWYWFNRRNATFFVSDSRTERTEVDIMSREQMDAIREWANDPDHAEKIKFFVSSTPVISQASKDSWTGYPAQQRELIEIMLSVTEGYAFILTGDAHCLRTGIYQIHDGDHDTERQVVEILSSGISSAANDAGKPFIREIQSEPKDYDQDNDFPMIVDNTENGGLRFVTNYATKTFPDKHKSLIKHVIKGGVDHVFTDVVVYEKSVHVKAMNHKGELLNTLVLND